MRRRGRPGWPRLLLGVVAAGIVFAMSSLMLVLMVSASSLPPAPAPTLCVRALPCGALPSPTAGQVQVTSPPPTLCVAGVCLPTPTPTPPPPSLPIPCVVACPGGQPQSPGGGNTPTPLPPGAPPSPSMGGLAPGAPGAPGGSSGAPGAGGGAPAFIGGAGAGSSTAVGGSGARLSLAAPPEVQLISPVAGLTFGKAPFLWPLFAALDLIAVVAVAVVLRKTWSKPTPD